jgi:phage-related minor tail protein
VAESNDAATATERAFANAFSGAEDSLVGFISTGKLAFQVSPTVSSPTSRA